jgi:hypothetical protein
MKFTPGPMVSAVSGSVGGQTFSRNRGGQYVRARAIPITSTTTYALAAKARLSTASSAWQGLTAGERQAWAQWANANPVVNTLGNSITLTGQQGFVGNHTRLSLAGVATLTTPPIIPAPISLTTATQDGDIGTGDVDLTFAASPLGAAEYLWMRAAVTNSAGINYIQNLLRFIGVSGAAASTPYDNQAQIESRLGTLVVGQTLHVEASVFSSVSGLLSQPIKTSVVITTT